MGRAGSNLTSLLLHIEQPLRDATHVVEALRLVGYGLVLHDHAGGDAVAELARIAAERLQVVEDMWNEVLGARRRGKW
jgi:predicted ATPase